MSRVIVVTGPDGAGKSSVCRRLQDLLPASCVIDIWTGLNQSPFYPNKSSVHEYLKAIDPASRGLLILHSLSRSLHQALAQRPPYIIADGYWYKYAVTELALSNNMAGFQIAQTIFPKPQLCFFLDVTPEAALSRKSQLSSYESGFCDDERKEEFFLQFQRKIYKGWQKIISENPDWHIVNTETHAIESSALLIHNMIHESHA